MRLLLVIGIMGAALGAPSHARAQGDYFLATQHQMTERANLCNSALTRQAEKEREKTKVAYKSAARLYMFMAEGMSGLRQSEAVYGKSGLSWWALRGTARKCASFLPAEVGAVLGEVRGYPDQDYLRAEACAATLNYALDLSGQMTFADGDGPRATLEAVRGRLNVYAAAVRELRGKGAVIGAGHDRGAAFLQARYGRAYAEPEDIEACWEVGRKILFSVPDPK